MHQIIYTSEATSNLGSGEVFKIIEKSASNNAKNDLTGFLLYSNGRFLQILEGPEQAINRLMEKIELDPRHQSIIIIDRISISDRAFPKWKMKRLMPATDAHTITAKLPELGNASVKITDAVERFLQADAALQSAQ